MTAAGTASGAVAQLSLAAARRHGIGPREYQGLTGIHEAEARPQARLAAPKFVALLEVAERRLRSEWPLDATALTPEVPPFGALLALVTNAPSLDEAFRHYLHYRPLIGDVDALAMRRAGDEYEFTYDLPGAPAQVIGALGNLSLMLRLARQYLGTPARNAVMEFAGDAFAPLSQMQAMVGCSVRFRQGANRLRLVAPGALSPYERHNGISHDLLRRQADHELALLREQGSFAAQVERHLARTLVEGGRASARAAPLAQLCDQLQLSRSALHRRLQREGTNLQSLLAKARLLEAQRLLDERTLSIADISDLLGFASSSTFSRFFSESVGRSPSQYRLGRRAD